MASRIPMRTPLVEMDGDEMTRVLWKEVKQRLLEPFVELRTAYFDLSVQNRDATEDQVTRDAAAATLELGVAVKCATITATPERVKEYQLQHLLPSPNGTLRAALDGTVFRKPILLRNVQPSLPGWRAPIHIARHAYGDVYKNAELAVPGPGKAELVFTGADGTVLRKTICDMPGAGVLQGIHNLEASIESFARACARYALSERLDVWFGAKDTISKTYDGRFKAIFDQVFRQEFAQEFQAAGLTYFYSLIDDVVARIVKSEGGMLWACKNYDGDVMSDLVAAANGSLAMMTSVLVSPKGVFEFEAAHGTVQQHYYRYLKGERTSTNPVALIFAWTGGLRKRGMLDDLQPLQDFATRLEQAVLDTLEAGIVTGDLAKLVQPPPQEVVDSWRFLDLVASRL